MCTFTTSYSSYGNHLPIQSRLERPKAKMCNIPKEPKSVEKIVQNIPEVLTKTTDNGVFLRHCRFVSDSKTGTFLAAERG